MKTTKNFVSLNFIKLLLCLLATASCSKFKLTETNAANPNDMQYAPEHRDNSIIVWKNPSASEEEFAAWKARRGLNTPGGNTKKLCEFCSAEDDLELYNGVLMTTMIQGSGSGGGGTTCTGTHCGPSGGGDDTASFCYNFSMDLPEPTGPIDSVNHDMIPYFNLKRKYPVPADINLPSQNGLSGAAVTVAIFDTGLEPGITGQYCSGLSSSCNTQALRGWNYSVTPNNANTADDYPHRHGSAVSKFIIDEVLHYQNQKVNIIPVKIHDATGRCDMYNVLCGILYASKSNVNIINASFGFYWDDANSYPYLFGEFIKHYLTEKGIIMVAAAGNEEPQDDNFAMINLGIPQPLLRSLDVHPFYPACFAGKQGFENVISATTFSISDGNRVSRYQNFSPRYVDVAVNADFVYNRLNMTTTVIETEYGFIDPLRRLNPHSGSTLIISGTSYATPIITGKIVAYYNDLTQGMLGVGTPNRIDKNQLFSRMEAHGLVYIDNINLPLQVNRGKYAQNSGTPY